MILGILFYEQRIFRASGHRKRVKQGCPLLPILVEICKHPKFDSSRKFTERFSGYQSDIPRNRFQYAYSDERVLIDSTVQGIQYSINGEEKFFNFANIKLNVSKSQTSKVNEKGVLRRKIAIK
jgi:hypothetical protein